MTFHQTPTREEYDDDLDTLALAISIVVYALLFGAHLAGLIA